MEQVQQGQIDLPAIEALAEACHEAWQRERENEDWQWGPTTDAKAKIHRLLKPYADLDEAGKERNRLTARLTQAKLLGLGYRMERKSRSDQPPEFSEEEQRWLMRVEHDIWMRDRLLGGYEWAPKTDDDRRLHVDVTPFDQVPESDQALDRAIVESIIPALWSKGYKLVRV